MIDATVSEPPMLTLVAADAGADTAAMSSTAIMAAIPNPFGFVIPFMLFPPLCSVFYLP